MKASDRVSGNGSFVEDTRAVAPITALESRDLNFEQTSGWWFYLSEVLVEPRLVMTGSYKHLVTGNPFSGQLLSRRRSEIQEGMMVARTVAVWYYLCEGWPR